MISIDSLTKEDVGRWVTYTARDGHTEIGKLKSWNSVYIFVVYNANDNWDGDHWKDYTGVATGPEYLEFGR